MNKNRAIRKDHKLMMKVRKIEQEIQELCQQLTKECGMEIWTFDDALELAEGTTVAELKRMRKYGETTQLQNISRKLDTLLGQKTDIDLPATIRRQINGEIHGCTRLPNDWPSILRSR